MRDLIDAISPSHATSCFDFKAQAGLTSSHHAVRDVRCRGRKPAPKPNTCLIAFKSNERNGPRGQSVNRACRMSRGLLPFFLLVQAGLSVFFTLSRYRLRCSVQLPALFARVDSFASTGSLFSSLALHQDRFYLSGLAPIYGRLARSTRLHPALPPLVESTKNGLRRL